MQGVVSAVVVGLVVVLGFKGAVTYRAHLEDQARRLERLEWQAQAELTALDRACRLYPYKAPCRQVF